jgi:Trypsin-like serine proteases, typically periplasmic, contain C-terminal PDZ domain
MIRVLIVLALAAPLFAQEKSSAVRVATLGGAGSGTVVARDGETAYILTNKHVAIDENQQVESHFWIISDGKRYPASFVKMHRVNDLALLSAKIDLPAVTLADADPKEGDTVKHNGQATGPQEGKVVEWTKFVVEGPTLTSTMFSTHGDSGAGVFNADGKLVGCFYGSKGPRTPDRLAIAVRLEVVRDFLKGVGK